jgi:hypothetical protein
MINFGNLTKKIIYGKVKSIGVVKGIGFIPNDEYYIDEHTYLFGFRLNTIRYWDEDDYKLKRKPKKNRFVVEGFKKEKEVK